MSIADITLLRPLWLLAPPVILLLALGLRIRGDLGDWRAAVDPHLLAALERRGAVVAGSAQWKLSPWLIAAALIGAALAGPALQRADVSAYRNLDGVVIAMDVSRSVTQGGAAREARLAASQVAEAAGSRQVALIVYAGDAYVGAAFSADHDALRSLIMAEAADLVPDAGSVASRGIALAHAMLVRANMIGGDVVVATDGGGIDAAAERIASQLRAEGRHVHVLFVPTPSQPASAPPADEPAARMLAIAGGGAFADVRAPSAIVETIADSPVRRLGASRYSALAWTDLGRYVLLAAMLPLLLVFRRRL